MEDMHTSKPSVVAWFLSTALLLQACGAPDLVETPEPGAQQPQTPLALERGADTSEDILVQLQAIPGLTVRREAPSPIPGTRFFLLSFQQPADHRQPAGEQFPLRLWLLHRSVSAPMALLSTGYGGVGIPFEFELTALLGANQIVLEHRFFGPSRPASNNWKHLDIWQGANDMHRIVQALKPLYPQRWLTSGLSKGGMTSVYHRYFFPDDVDATVAYVAPNSFGVDDPRYIHFLQHVGEASCRARIRDLQVDALRRREQLLPVLQQWAEANGVMFEHLGLDKSLEFAVTELPFSFWQYFGPELCAEIPLPGAPVQTVFNFLNEVVPFASGYGDRAFEFYEAYNYQAATELGSYRLPEAHLRGLLRYPGQNTPTSYVSFPITEAFDEDLMFRVGLWVFLKGSRMMFIYGETDPWSAGAFEVRRRNDSFRFYAPGANHSTAELITLPEADRALAVERLSSWMNVSIPPARLETRRDEAARAPSPLRDRRLRL
ncbi:hypothetical protein JY572_11760 [Myxococcus landrumensis]|uniref:Uncharacterized protein n=2 Tax=Myxococcus landrumensis TaxID=2813577 RepID=A0ABX7NE74_9BACT|nr:hypothetical protein JY572_11760 [Myxococcus landrumus]